MSKKIEKRKSKASRSSALRYCDFISEDDRLTNAVRCEPDAQPSGPPPFAAPGDSGVLSRLRAFMPSLRNSEKELEERISKQGAESVNIENVIEEEQHIEMDLALGVLEEQRQLNEGSIKIPGAPALGSHSPEADEEEDAVLVPASPTSFAMRKEESPPRPASLPPPAEAADKSGGRITGAKSMEVDAGVLLSAVQTTSASDTTSTAQARGGQGRKRKPLIVPVSDVDDADPGAGETMLASTRRGISGTHKHITEVDG